MTDDTGRMLSTPLFTVLNSKKTVVHLLNTPFIVFCHFCTKCALSCSFEKYVLLKVNKLMFYNCVKLLTLI